MTVAMLIFNILAIHAIVANAANAAAYAKLVVIIIE